MREGTAGSELGKRRLGIARSPLRAGCFSHLQKPYGSEAPPDSRITRPPSAPHIFFTLPIAYAGSWQRAPRGHDLRCRAAPAVRRVWS